MFRLKEYFSDGMLQIAIVLSLFRTDLDIYFGSRYHLRQLELQENVLGQHYGYTRTDFRSYGNWRDEFFPQKQVETFGSDDIFRDLHSLADYRRFNGIRTTLDAWLVNGPEPQLPLQRAQEAENANSGNIPAELSGAAQREGLVAEAGASSFSAYFGTELTKEDMDLIDILWRQDIDIGISRDVFESSLRPEQDKKPEAKDIANRTTEEVNNTESDGNQQAQQFDETGNYGVDSETGELIPITPTVSAADVSELLQQLSAGFVDNDNNQVNQMNAFNVSQSSVYPSSLYQQPQHIQPDVTNDRPSNTDFDYSLGGLLSRQNSLDRNWQDVLSLLGDDNLAFNDALTVADQPSPVLVAPSLPAVSTNHSYTGAIAVQQFTSHLGQLNDSQGFNPMNFDLDATVQPMNGVLFQNVSMAANQLNDSFSLMQNFSSMPTITSPYQFANGLDNTTYSPALSPVFSLARSLSQSSNFSLSSYLRSVNLTGGPSFEASAMLNDAGVEPMMMNYSEPGNISFDAERLSLVPYASNDSFIQQLLQNDLNDLTFDDNFDEDPTELDCDALNDDWATESASLPSPTALCSGSVKDYLSCIDGLDETEGATGGKDTIKYADMENFVKYDSDYGSLSPNLHSNSSCSSNSTEPKRPQAVASPKNVYHNHTYYLQPGQMSREEKEAEVKREKEEKATRSRDDKRAKALKLPFGVDEIIYLPVDQFTDMLSRYSLSEAQYQLVRDIRRRGKNKAAAQNCRKRKMEVIDTLEQEVEQLRQQRDRLQRNKLQLNSESEQLKDKFARLQTDLLKSLRDASGQRYDPELYSLQRTSDGDIILVPKNSTSAASEYPSGASGNAHDEKSGRKRKPKRKD